MEPVRANYHAPVVLQALDNNGCSMVSCITSACGERATLILETFQYVVKHNHRTFFWYMLLHRFLTVCDDRYSHLSLMFESLRDCSGKCVLGV